MNIGAIEIYLVEASIFLVILYIFNKLLLCRETLHEFNRCVWLATIVGSFLLPFAVGRLGVGIGGGEEIEAVGGVAATEIGAIDVEVATGSKLDIVTKILFAIYVCGVIGYTIHTLLLHLKLARFIYRNPYNLRLTQCDKDQELAAKLRSYEIEMGITDRVEYIIHDGELSPFSWFRYIVVSRSDIEESCREIIIHELSHIKGRHSYDIVLATLATILLWFNPASWLTKRALQQVHEYCADDSVLSQGVEAKRYQLLLIKTSVGSRLYSISNTLNHSNLKSRITMMLKKKSPTMAWAKSLYAIPLLLIAIILLSSPTVAQGVDALSEVKVTNNIANDEAPTDKKAEDAESDNVDKPFLFVEVMPKFQGGDLAGFRRWCMENIRYPKELEEQKLSGRVIASFIVKKDGSVSTVNILHTPHELFSQEVIRLLESSPKWTPGMQRGESVDLKFTLPLEFSIKDDSPAEEPASTSSKGVE